MKRLGAILICALALSGCGGGSSSQSVPVTPQTVGTSQTIPILSGSPAAGPYLYGTTYLNTALSVYSESSNAFVEQIQQAGCGQVTLFSLAFSPDRSLLYEAESNNGKAGSPNQIAILSTSNNQFTGAIPVPADFHQIHGLALSGDGSALYANMASQSNGNLSAIGFFDTASRTLSGTLQTQRVYSDDSIAVNPHTGLVYAAGLQYLATSPSTAFVDVIDPTTRKIVRTFALGGTDTQADGAAFDAAGNTLYVRFHDIISPTKVDEILALDASSGSVLDTIPLPTDIHSYGGTNPRILITGNNHLYAGVGDRTIDVFDLNNHHALISSITVPEFTYDGGMALNALQSTLYVSGNTHIYTISTASNTITGSFVTAPKYPQYQQFELAAQ